MLIDLGPVWLTLKLAGTTVLILLLIATPVAWWLAHTKSRFSLFIETVVALPLVLPPTVLGFYLLLLLGPDGPVGAPWVYFTGQTLTFSFAGLVLASILYSLPFAVQPLHAAFETVGKRPLETAATLGATPFDAFISVASPMALRGYITAAVLSFAHTVGEFGVVLMVGGNIPGETKVIAISVFESVETLDYAAAHTLSAGLIIMAFVVLLFVYTVNRRFPIRLG